MPQLAAKAFSRFVCPEDDKNACVWQDTSLQFQRLRHRASSRCNEMSSRHILSILLPGTRRRNALSACAAHFVAVYPATDGRSLADSRTGDTTLHYVSMFCS